MIWFSLILNVTLSCKAIYIYIYVCVCVCVCVCLCSLIKDVWKIWLLSEFSLWRYGLPSSPFINLEVLVPSKQSTQKLGPHHLLRRALQSLTKEESLVVVERQPDTRSTTLAKVLTIIACSWSFYFIYF